MKKSAKILAAALAVVIILIIGIWIYYNQVLERSGISETSTNTYQWHYVMITTDSNSVMWESIYDSASKAASQNDAFLEYLKNDTTTSYTTEDFMKIAIASKVDGILVEGDGSTALNDEIDEASDAGIPVITMMQDCVSKRVSFVGVNAYELGSTYGQQILSCINDDTHDILIILDKSGNQDETSLMYTQMKDTIMKGLGDPPAAHVTSQSVNSFTTFDSEEDIRNILTSDNPPGMLVCLNVTNTVSAYQALIDYNKVGTIGLAGYYQNDTIFSAIRNDVISFTISINAEEMGQKCIEALTEYKNMGYVSNYFSVQLEVIDKSNIDNYDPLKTASNGESNAGNS